MISASIDSICLQDINEERTDIKQILLDAQIVESVILDFKSVDFKVEKECKVNIQVAAQENDPDKDCWIYNRSWFKF